MKTLIILLMAATAYGSTAWENSLADAIFKAEGGHKTKHEYGILAHYQHTTPRQACLNTISHPRKDAGMHQDGLATSWSTLAAPIVLWGL